MTVTVYSTLSSSVSYHLYFKKADKNALNRVEKTVTINGGANVSDKNLYTPRGIVNHIQDDQFEMLQEDSVFKLHVENGFITFEKGKKDNVEKAVKGMSKKDKSAQKVKSDYKNPPTSNVENDES